jgi:hypothetical protein
MRATRPSRRALLAVDILEERLALARGLAAAVMHHEHAAPAHALPGVRAAAVAHFPFENPILPEYPAIERVAYYNRATRQFEPFTAEHTITNSTATPHNVYVISHGWAPGYLPWVENIQKQKGHPLPLSWNTWQGNGEKPGPGPSTPWLFAPSETDHVGRFPFPISSKGLAQQILDVDRGATVVAYSWIDDSATTTGFGGFPNTPEHSQGYTTMDGMRMAQAIMDVLAPNYYQGLGKVHLIGHSHGARVATEAALALQQAGKINPQFNVVGQLTLFDSPENNQASTNDRNPIWIDAANYDWFLLSQLNIARAVSLVGTITSGQTGVMLNNPPLPVSSPLNLVDGMGVMGDGISPGTTIKVDPVTRQVTLSKPATQTAENVRLDFSPPPGSIFVDSYNSYFGSDLGNFVVNDPEQGIFDRHLNNLIDVELVPLNRAFDAFKFSAMHQYAANWYAGSVVTQQMATLPAVGIRWSPLLPGAQPVSYSQYKQEWSYSDAKESNQFKLEPDVQAPVTPRFFDTPLKGLISIGKVTRVTNSSNQVTAVTLSSARGGPAVFVGEAHRRNQVVGFSFDCNFSQIGDGSQLQILLNGSVYFAMSGAVAGSSSLPGNASFKTTFGFASAGNDPRITMRLVRPASGTGTPTVVAVSNFHEFTD